jgi:enoyl-CoA hydratase/carnithine racemase
MNADSTQGTMRCLMSREGAVATLTIDNQARRNALSAPVRDEMVAHLHELMGDKSCRAIIVTGAGGFFSAGGDVKAMRERNYQAQPRVVPGVPDLVSGRESRNLQRLILAGPKPVIAAVEGGAFGVALSLVASADYVISTPTARFQASQVRRGLIPDGGMFYTIAARCGLGRARELLVSGREFNGVEAERYGLVHELVQPGRVMEAAVEAAARYAELPPLSVAFTKSALSYNFHTLDEAIEAERYFQPIVHETKDHKEAVSAFLDKRKPVFTGE